MNPLWPVERRGMGFRRGTARAHPRREGTRGVSGGEGGRHRRCCSAGAGHLLGPCAAADRGPHPRPQADPRARPWCRGRSCQRHSLGGAELVAERCGWTIARSGVQSNVVGYTGVSGFLRLARQAHFVGDVQPGDTYVLVDDFIGQGGTLANPRGHILGQGAHVVAAKVPTGKPHSARLTLSAETLSDPRRKHGSELEEWGQDRFGHAFDCLTESEARYLPRTPDAHRVRDRIAAEEHGGDR